MRKHGEQKDTDDILTRYPDGAGTGYHRRDRRDPGEDIRGDIRGLASTANRTGPRSTTSAGHNHTTVGPREALTAGKRNYWRSSHRRYPPFGEFKRSADSLSPPPPGIARPREPNRQRPHRHQHRNRHRPIHQAYSGFKGPYHRPQSRWKSNRGTSWRCPTSPSTHRGGTNPHADSGSCDFLATANLRINVASANTAAKCKYASAKTRGKN